MLKRLLLTGHLDGRAEALAQLATLVEQRKPSAVLFAGGILGGNTPQAERTKRLEDALDGFGKLGVFTAVTPGPGDVPLREFLRLAKSAELSHPHLRCVHATMFTQNDHAVCGLGGELTEGEDRTEDRLCYSRTSAEYFLRTFWYSRQPHKALLLSVVPPGPLGGEAGNRIAGDFIDSYHPSLCVAAGTTERRGFQQIAHTLVVNPGRLADGSAAWLDWGRSRGEQVELLRL
jgi:Icc-related predicted phosphoesterase